MKKVGIIPNLSKDSNLEFTSKIIGWVEEQGGKVYLNEIAANKMGRMDLACRASTMYKEVDFVIVLGGDGTLLSVARQVAWHETPILGVNLGHLGFLAEVEVKNLYSALEKVMKGQYMIEKRMMLEASVIKDNIQAETFYALNDIGITKGSFSRIVKLKTYVNNCLVDIYSADGLIVSSPTGSTAYSLSAGGPIVNPSMSLLIITPICPHTLNARSIVISDKEKVRVEVEDNYHDTMLTIDGQQGYKLKGGDVIIVSKADFYANLIKITDRCFYELLRKKISGRNLEEDCENNL
jgi:NAD+ kinase